VGFCNRNGTPWLGGGGGGAGQWLSSVRVVYCDCYNINQRPLFATCEFVCDCISEQCDWSIGAAAFTMATLQKYCGPIHLCPDQITTVTTATFVLGIAITENVRITTCVPRPAWGFPIRPAVRRQTGT
jgi:hypothetical protein